MRLHPIGLIIASISAFCLPVFASPYGAGAGPDDDDFAPSCQKALVRLATQKL